MDPPLGRSEKQDRPYRGGRVESAAMNAAMSFFPALAFVVPALLWYIAVLVLLFKIWQELKAIRLSR